MILRILIFADVEGSLINLANILQSFVIGALTLAFAYGGYLWMTSTTNPSRRSEAYGYLFGAAFGAAVILLANTFATNIGNAIIP